MHYKPGIDERTLKNVDVLAKSTTEKLIVLINDQESNETLHKRSQSAWTRLETALGASIISDTEMLIANNEVHWEDMLAKQIDLRVSIIQSLYEKELRSSHALEGSIIYNLIFSEAGYIRDIEIKEAPSTMAILAKYIAPSLLTLRIPTEDAPRTIDYPLNFFPHRPSNAM